MADTATATNPARATRTRRALTTAARFATRYSDPAFTAAFALILAGAVFDTGPAWATEASDTELMVYGLAVYGLNRAFDAVAYTLADFLDPDARDGDAAHGITDLAMQLNDDIRTGADSGEVLENVRSSSFLLPLATALSSLGDARGEDGAPADAHPLYGAASLLTRAAELLHGRPQ